MRYSLVMCRIKCFSGVFAVSGRRGKKVLFLALLPFLFGLLSCVTLKPLSFATLSGGSYSGVEREEQLVIDSQTEYAELMEKLGRAEDTKEIDFSRFIVIAVFMGEKPTGGYDIRIQSIVRKDGLLEVHVLTRVPKEGEMVTQALSSPYHIVLCPRPSGKDSFNKSDTSDIDFLYVDLE